MNSRSESRLRYRAVSGFVALGVVAAAPRPPARPGGRPSGDVQQRGARVPPGRMNESQLRQALVEVVAPALERVT